MSFKPMKTSVALASALSLTAFGLVAAPAQAAEGDVTLAPAAGTGTSVFTTDDMELAVEISNVVTPTTLAYRIDNPDQAQLHIDVQADEADVYGIKADGSTIDTGDFGDNTVFGNGLVVDFKELDIVSVVIFEMSNDTEDGGYPTATNGTIDIQLDETATDTAVDDTAVAGLEFDDVTDPVSVTVNAWVETGAGNTLSDALTIDSTFSDSQVVTFVPPQDVSVITQAERFVGATGDDGLEKATATVDYFFTSAAPDVADDGDLESGSTIDGNVIATGDRVLVQDSTDGTSDGIYTITDGAAPTATDVALDATDFVLVTSGSANAGKVFTANTGTNRVSEYNTDGTISTFNAGGDTYFGASLRFSNSQINLAQVDLSKWEFAVDASNTDDFGYADASYLRPARPAGQSSDATIDALGRLLVQAPVSDISLNEEATYKLKLRHSEITATEFISSGYQVVKSPSADADEVSATVADSDNVNIADFANGDYDVAVRNGTDSITWVGQAQKGDGTDLEASNVPMIAVVTAGSAFARGETLTVSGSTQKITTASGTLVIAGLTNKDGQYSVTVTSSDSSSASAKYSIQFYVLEDGVGWQTDNADGGAALYSVDYSSGVLASTDAFTADDSVVSGSEVTVSFSVVDQFGEPLSATSSGKTYSVELQASNDDNLDLDAAVVDGAVSFTFDNYVAAGGSDVLTAKLYTGSSTSPSFVSGQTVNVTLYNTNAVAGVNVPVELTAIDITYVDFFDGKAAAGQLVATGGRDLAGTVVDSNGAGVPGAPVTISADGFQFKSGTTFARDSITLNADAAGAFTVELWSQVISDVDGIDIQVVSGGVTAESNVVVSIPTNPDPGNVRMSWNVPEVTLMNTTYGITATVVDVFGNPIKGADVKFTGLAAAEFNGLGNTTRTTGADGTAIAYLRSIKDVDGLSAISLELLDSGVDFTPNPDAAITDNSKTSWDETDFDNELTQEITFFKSAADAPQTSTQKVNAGSFKGYVAVYALGYEGQRLSAKIGNDWVIVDPIVNNESANLARVTDFTGAGVDIAVRIYIDRVLIDTINLTTK